MSHESQESSWKYLHWSFVAAGLTLAVPATAQDLEEIIVTATKREQSAQDVGISIAAYSGETLQNLRVQSSVDLARLTPGVSVAGSYGGQFLTFSIRGVTQNDYLDHTEAPTSVYVDEAYVAMMTSQQFALFDVERAEILKGPQGTLFGRNSTGGTVNFVTRKPSDEASGYVDASYASYDLFRVEAALGGPVSDRVSMRGAFAYEDSSPILDNSVSGSGDLWASETYAGRLHAKFDLTDNATLLVTGYGGRSEQPSSPWQWQGSIVEVDSQGRAINVHRVGPGETRECIGPGGANTDCGNDVLGAPDGFTLTRPVPGGDFFGYRERIGELDVAQDVPRGNPNILDLYGGTINLQVDFTSGTSLVSVTDYKIAKKDFQLDGNVSPARAINTIAIAETTSYSEELRLQGSTDRWQWVTGLYLLGIEADVPTAGIWLPVDGDSPTILIAGLQGLQLLDDYRLDTRSYSLFGQVEYELTNTVTAIAGLRGTREEKDFEYRSDVFLQTNPSNPRTFHQGMFIAPTRAYEDESSDTLYSARAQLNWKPQDNLLVYGSFNRGVKAGGFNAPFGGGSVITDEEIPYDPETLNAYEAGMKSTFWDGRARVNGSLFYYDYRNYQTFQFVGLTSQVTNNDAEYKGADLEINLRPTDGLTVALSASYLDTKVFDVSSFGIVGDKEASYAPEFQASGLGRYEWPVLGGRAAAQLSFASSSSFYYSLTNFDALEADGHTAWDGLLAYQWPDSKFELSLFVQNILDDRYDTLGFDLSSSCGCSLAAFAKPRTYGIGLNYRL